MANTEAKQSSLLRPLGRKALTFSAGMWLLIALAGQWGFSYFIGMFYGAPLLEGDLFAWNKQPLLAQPPVAEGKLADTLAFAAHALGAGIVFLTGSLQLVPYLRRKFPAFHRWNGRAFVFLVVTLSLSGFYLTWVRGPVPDSFSDLSTSANGLLILAFAYLTVQAALQRKYRVHERWAFRLYLVSNAQWFLRIGGFGYFAAAQMAGAEVAFDGWFFKFWGWGCFLVPLGVLQLYFLARDSRIAAVKVATATGLTVLAVCTGFGSAVLTTFLLDIVAKAAAAG